MRWCHLLESPSSPASSVLSVTEILAINSYLGKTRLAKELWGKQEMRKTLKKTRTKKIHFLKDTVLHLWTSIVKILTKRRESLEKHLCHAITIKPLSKFATVPKIIPEIEGTWMYTRLYSHKCTSVIQIRCSEQSLTKRDTAYWETSLHASQPQNTKL